MLTVFVVSDATGRTAEQMVRSALVQFDGASVHIERRSRIRTEAQIRALVQQAADGNALIMHTLVSNDLRRAMLAEARTHGVDSLDLLGPLLERLTVHLGVTPQEKPGLFQQLAESRTREIETVAFAFRHDDGQNVDGLRQAEVVLVGASRTMKTPTTLYLAYRGWFAANVPLIPHQPVPDALLTLPAERVFCLSMHQEHLRRLRIERATLEAIPMEPYTSVRHIEEECRYVEQLRQRHGWERIDVTGKAVEEVAREIISLLPPQQPRGL